ncbi:MAG: esterase family protein [Saprospiraceae bacterium]|nr:esterase family protein [Saprospiraceae bacterium]
MTIEDWYSHYLNRNVVVDLYFPPNWNTLDRSEVSLLICNDGQDLNTMNFMAMYEDFHHTNSLDCAFITVALHAGSDRMNEYGVASKLDYLHRGKKAWAYQYFITKEILPWIHRDYALNITPANSVIAGFSLGGLSAFDIAWHNTDTFGKVGVFSGSLWWRSKPVDNTNPDQDLIMQNIVKNDYRTPKIKFWFQVGTNDEIEDRNNNGIIDAIDDTRLMISMLIEKGIQLKNIHYEEVEGGEHDVPTWGSVMPSFLNWAFKKN